MSGIFPKYIWDLRSQNPSYKGLCQGPPPLAAGVCRRLVAVAILTPHSFLDPGDIHQLMALIPSFGFLYSSPNGQIGQK